MIADIIAVLQPCRSCDKNTDKIYGIRNVRQEILLALCPDCWEDLCQMIYWNKKKWSPK